MRPKTTLARRAGAALLCAALAAGANAASDPVPDAGQLPALTDQKGGHVVLDPDADVTVAIVITAKRLRRIRKWEEALHRDFPAIKPLLIADIPQTPPPEFNQVAEKLRRWVPEGVAVGIDIDGAWAATLGLTTSMPNILIFEHGELRYSQRGKYRQSLYESLRAQLADALKETGESSDSDEH